VRASVCCTRLTLRPTRLLGFCRCLTVPSSLQLQGPSEKRGARSSLACHRLWRKPVLVRAHPEKRWAWCLTPLPSNTRQAGRTCGMMRGCASLTSAPRLCRLRACFSRR